MININLRGECWDSYYKGWDRVDSLFIDRVITKLNAALPLPAFLQGNIKKELIW